jgi:hypothetical protein
MLRDLNTTINLIIVIKGRCLPSVVDILQKKKASNMKPKGIQRAYKRIKLK